MESPKKATSKETVLIKDNVFIHLKVQLNTADGIKATHDPFHCKLA